jgi:hypothetical protein
VLQPPRGKAALVSQQTRRVEGTLAIYRHLIRQSHKSSEVQAALNQAQQTMRLDWRLSDYLRTFHDRPDAVTIAFAQRWLRRRNVDVDLIGKAPHWESPRSILQQYLYKKRQYQRHVDFLEKIYQLDPSMRQYVTEVWIREYLDVG